MCKRSNLSNTLMTILVASIITSCGNGNNSQQVAKVTPKPDGPISYLKLQHGFSESNTVLSKHAIQTTSTVCGGGGTGSILGTLHDGITIANAAVSFIPEAGMVGTILGKASSVNSVVSLLGNNNGNNCITQEFDQLQLQLNAQAQEINNIESNFQLATNIIWQSIAGNSSAVASGAFTNFIQSVQSINGQYSGLVYVVMSNAGFWNSNTYLPESGYTMEDFIKNENGNYDALYSTLTPATDFNQTIQNVAGISMTPNESGLYNVASNANSQSVQLYMDLYNNLVPSLSSIAESDSAANLIYFIGQYNQSVMAIYQNSLYALNQAYQVLYFINYSNYYSYSLSLNEDKYLKNYASLSNMYYNPHDAGSLTESSLQASAYNTAQQNLTDFFAQAINQAYLNALNFIVTDPAVGNQTYPVQYLYEYDIPTNSVVKTGESYNIEKYLGTGTLANGSSVGTAKEVLYQAMEASNSNTGPNLIQSLKNAESVVPTLYYQFPFIYNTSNILKSLQTYDGPNGPGITGNMNNFFESNPSVTTPLFYGLLEQPVNSSIMSWTTINPYYVSSATNPYNVLSGTPLLMGYIGNNIAACNGNDLPGGLTGFSLYNYTPNSTFPTLGEAGVPYLSCGNWDTTGFPTNGQITYANDIWNSTHYTLNPVGNISNAWEYGTFFVSPNSNGTTILNANNTNWACAPNDQSGSQYTLTNGDNCYYFMAGWMNDNSPSATYGFANVAAVQMTAADGFIMPMVLTVLNITNWGGNYIALSPLPSALQVTIGNSPLYNMSNISYIGNPSNTSWMPTYNSNYPFTDSGTGGSFYGSVLNINGSNVALTVQPGQEYGWYNNQWVDPDANVDFTFNPTSCDTTINSNGNFTEDYTAQQAGYWSCN